MSDIVIAVEHLSKRYLIGHRAAERERYDTLRDAIGREARGFIRKAGDLWHGRPIVQGDRVEEFWALRDVAFEVRQGEAVGIIGRNGAGKSTLLKILSRITEPTAGRARLKGRVASLLEVGTGFHPELSGRENIYLNGAILGMSRAEIRRQFDEIVAFAEVEEFLDTPVKRYSSGMYVRLAFAVAAHLEAEILFVDEVLSVGDAEFQRKCLGKIQQVARCGRTVLFVSHNLSAIRTLTRSALVLERGRTVYYGATEDAIACYAKRQADAPAALTGSPASSLASAPANRGWHAAIRAADLLDAAGQPTQRYSAGDALRLRVTIETDGAPGLSFDAFLLDRNGARIGLYAEHHFYGRGLPRQAGVYEYRVDLNPLWLAAGAYSFDLAISVTHVTWDHYVQRAVAFEVAYCNPGAASWDFTQAGGYGVVALTEKSQRRCRALPAAAVETAAVQDQPA